jgi:small-conductance mechanosensitive channel
MPFYFKAVNRFKGHTAVSIAIFLLVFAVPAQCALKAAASKAKPAVIQKSESNAPSFSPVSIDGDVLFYVKERVYSFSPQERARLISERLARLVSDPDFDPSLITTGESENTSEILYGDTVIMSVTDGDAKSEGVARAELARSYALRIKDTVEQRRREYSLKAILTGAAWALVLTLLLLLLLRLNRKLFARALAKLHSWKGTRIHAIKVQGVEVVSAGRLASVLMRIVKTFRLFVVLVLLYSYLMLVLSFFPITRKYEASALRHLVSVLLAIWHQLLGYLPDLLFVAVIVVVLRYVIMATRFGFGLVEQGKLTIPGFYPEWARPTFNIARFLIIAFGAVVLFPYLPGSSSSAFKGVSIFIGVLFSLGSTSVIANMVAGIVLTYMRAFNVGDRVKIGDTTGDVIEKTLLVTRVQTIKHVEIAIPNSMVIGSHIVNFSASAKDEGLILNTSVTIGYDADWRKVHELLIAAAKTTRDVFSEPSPFVLQTSLNDFFVTYELNAYTDKPHVMARTYSELHQNIQDKFNEAGIEIMSPHYTAVRDGNAIAVPPERLPKDYRPGGIRIFNWPGKDPG